MRPRGSISPRIYGSLWDLQRRLMDDVGGMAAVAKFCKRSVSILHAYTDENRPRPISMPLHLAADLERRSNSKPLANYFATAAGFEIIPRARKNVYQTWLTHISRISTEFADILAQASKCLEKDGDINAKEAGPILKEIDEHLSCLAELRFALLEIIVAAEKAKVA